MKKTTNYLKVQSYIRSILNSFRRRVIRDPLIQKRLSVVFHNVLALFDFKKNYKSEVFDYKKILAGRRRFWTNEFDYGNTFYGISYTLKKYSRYNNKIRACIEHGVYFGDTVFPFEAIDSGLNGLLTFGKSRLKHLNSVAKVPVIPIGPYIHYAEPMLNEKEIEDLRKKRGRTLLVFPTHSIDRVVLEFDFDKFNAEIEKVVKKQDIKHVMVCMFYKDINMGRDEFYRNKGYQVVCNGYRCDPLFLQRLKTFIMLSDYTMSNSVGTHVGYCVHLGRPHYIFSQELSYNAYTTNDMENIMLKDSTKMEENEVREAFSVISNEITQEQKKVCNKYWGVEFIKSKEEMYGILKSFE